LTSDSSIPCKDWELSGSILFEPKLTQLLFLALDAINPIVLADPDPKALIRAVESVESQGFRRATFFDSDADQGYTAACTGPVAPEQWMKDRLKV
jgi:hypothetical protein